MAREHQVEQTERLVTALQRHLHHFGFAGGEQIPGARQPKLGALLAKGHAHQLAKKPAQVPRSAMGHPGQFVETHFQQLSRRRPLQ